MPRQTTVLSSCRRGFFPKLLEWNTIKKAPHRHRFRSVALLAIHFYPNPYIPDLLSRPGYLMADFTSTLKYYFLRGRQPSQVLLQMLLEFFPSLNSRFQV